MSLEITQDNFDEVTSKSLPVIIDFWAPWCGPCRMVGPIVEELAETFKDKAVIGKLNVDENSELAQKFGVSSIPTILMLQDGKEVQRHIGAGSKESFAKMFDDWLK